LRPALLEERSQWSAISRVSSSLLLIHAM